MKVVLIEPGGFKTGIWDDMKAAIAEREGSRFEQSYHRSLELTRLTSRSWATRGGAPR